MLPGGDIGHAFPDAFPPLTKNESRGCRYEADSCTREILLDSILAREPNFLPNTSPVYSNAAFAVLGLVVESITGASFAQSLRDLLVEPLRLTGTSTSPPNSSAISVILNGSAYFWWDSDLSDAPSAAMGGMFSSANDLSAVGRAILSSTLLPANTTRAWLQPTAFTSSLTGAVGHGWEIYRHILSADANRVVDIFSKAGNWGSYGANLFLLPSYNIGVTILQAGSRGTTAVMSNLLATHLIPALEEAAREETDAAFAGTYTISGQNSSLTLTTTPGLAGLSITTWIRAGTDITALPLFADPAATSPRRFQLYPTNAHGDYAAPRDGTQSWRVKYFDWRGDGPFDACGSWATVDRPTYGLAGIDEFVFTLEAGRVKSVRPAAWKEEFTRV
jgi:CubicO group peptidase (beta-lactamase class C family)